MRNAFHTGQASLLMQSETAQAERGYSEVHLLIIE